MDSPLVPDEIYRRGEPSGKDDLIQIYHLSELAASVARQDLVSGAKRKLRKSYKNHIADLPGKHLIPARGETAWSLSDMARQPLPHVPEIADLDPQLLANLRFDRTPSTGIPGFDPKMLATAAAQGESNAYSAASSPSENKKKKKRDFSGAPVEKRRKI